MAKTLESEYGLGKTDCDTYNCHDKCLVFETKKVECKDIGYSDCMISTSSICGQYSCIWCAASPTPIVDSYESEFLSKMKQ